MFLASFDLLVAVNPLAERVGVVRCLDASGIDDAYARAFFAADHLSGKGVERGHNVVEYSIKFPLAEIIVDCLP